MFIISPRIGLCNQLQTIVKGILLSIKYKRDLYIDQFQIDLKSKALTDINNILNIKEINHLLIDKIKTTVKLVPSIDIEVIDNLNAYHLPHIDYSTVPTALYINDVIELNKEMDIIYLGNIVSLDIHTSFNYLWDDYTDNNLYYFIMTNIKFNPIFYTFKEYIKKELKLTNFNCIHLRIEDDALYHFSHCYKLPIAAYNEKLLKFYDDNIKSLSNMSYVCSGMLEFDNTINLTYYNNLIKNNTLLCDKKNIPIDSHYIHNRELIAIIDLLIAYDSDTFVGCHISSFSQFIRIHHIYNKKKVTLFT